MTKLQTESLVYRPRLSGKSGNLRSWSDFSFNIHFHAANTFGWRPVAFAHYGIKYFPTMTGVTPLFVAVRHYTVVIVLQFPMKVPRWSVAGNRISLCLYKCNAILAFELYCPLIWIFLLSSPSLLRFGDVSFSSVLSRFWVSPLSNRNVS